MHVLHKLRVLIVDDNKDIAHLLSKILNQAGCETKVAYDGSEAIKTFRNFKPETALIDIGLPGINGYQVAKEIKKQYANHNVTLVAITGYGEEKDILLSKKAGFDYHLTKPINTGELIGLINKNALKLNSD